MSAHPVQKSTLPLLAFDDPGAPLYWHQGEAVSRAQFATAAAALAEVLPDNRHVINRCSSRHGFSSVLVAAALRGQTCLLPGSDRLPAPLSEIYSDATIISDDSRIPATLHVSPLPPVNRSDNNSDDGDARMLDEIPAEHPLAIVFTSGSTGQPQANIKTWHSLWHAGRQIAARLLDGLDHARIVATVPMHHMYGLETSITLPLVSMHAAAEARPVFPEDVRHALSALSAPRVLVTTPVHLRALLAAAVKLPSLARIISATAPLPPALAAQAEAAFKAPVYEIYGCTEAGSIASRHSIEGSLWMPLQGLRLSQVDGRSLIAGEHLGQPVPLHDVLEADGDGFRLIGRSGDMVKVGGKRASLSDLTHKLLSIPGVIDGIVFQPDRGDENCVLQRLAALVVAPGLNEGQILHALSELVDPVFLPRPLRRVDDLPRNATGKLPRGALQSLLTHA